MINFDVLEVLKETSKKDYSEIQTLTGGSFFFGRVDSLVDPNTPDLYEYWGFIEGLALENKFNGFLKDWYKQNKNKVYIKVFE